MRVGRLSPVSIKAVDLGFTKTISAFTGKPRHTGAGRVFVPEASFEPGRQYRKSLGIQPHLRLLLAKVWF